MLGDAARGIGDPQVRNRGTIGGNVVHADPASDWPVVLTALNARFVIQGPGGSSRSVSPNDFFRTPFEPNLAANELLTAVEVPIFAANQRAEYAKVAHPASGYAVVCGAVVVTVEGDLCTSASIAVGGLVPAPVKATSVEQALIGQTLNVENIMAASIQVADDLGGDLIGDFYASAEYRKAIAAVEIRHALCHITGEVRLRPAALRRLPARQPCLPSNNSLSIKLKIESHQGIGRSGARFNERTNPPNKPYWAAGLF